MIVEKAGFFTTVQDNGLYGYQKYGMNTSGTMDKHAASLANLLVGNKPGEAVLECFYAGLSIHFTENTVISVTGGDFGPRLNHHDMQMYKAVMIKKGDCLELSDYKYGRFAYIAFAGGIKITEFLGCRSTFPQYGVGGYKGRKFKDGDELFLYEFAADTAKCENVFKKTDFSSKSISVRVLKGPQWDCFSDEIYQTFLSSEMTVLNETDRVGCRLHSDKPIYPKIDGGILSDGIVLGSVQVPSDGQPIIMMSDHPGLGGYAKIATVISEDIPLIAQANPGTRICFEEIGIKKAERLIRVRNRLYKNLEKKWRQY